MPSRLPIPLHLITASYIDSHLELREYISTSPELDQYLKSNSTEENKLWKSMLDKYFPKIQFNQLLRKSSIRTAKQDFDMVYSSMCSCVGSFGLTLSRCSKALRNEREVVLLAVKQNGLALEFASDRLKRDPEIVFTAIKNDKSALRFASKNAQ